MAPAMTEARRNMVAQNMTDPNVTKLFYNGRECAEVETKVTGKVPQWISGCMNRNGPGIFDIGDDTYGHWFDPLALMHRNDCEFFCFFDKLLFYKSLFFVLTFRSIIIFEVEPNVKKSKLFKYESVKLIEQN